MDPIRVVVCGTTFGRIYAAGIRALPDTYELVAMMSRGSEQSRRFAAELDVPLCTSIEELPDFDLACVVVRSEIVGGTGTQLAQRLLACGKHVLMEHPIHRDDAVACYREAARVRKSFLVNAFYRSSPTIAQYLRMVEVLRERYGIIHVDAECSVHFLFSMLDVIGRITGGFTPYDFDQRVQDVGVFTTVTGTVRSIPLCLRVVNRMNPEAPDDFVHVSHRVTVFTPGGNLVLTETDGEIIWHPNLGAPRDESGALEVDADDELSSSPLHEGLGVESEVTRRMQYEHIWPAAITACLGALHEKLEDPRHRAREAEYLLSLCSVWARVGQLIGPSRAIAAEMSAAPLDLARLAGLAAEGERRVTP
ncbi:MAG: Gfo/Idh/MocA family oxidoreductase [Brachybacterium sp.]|uniref:Gfo/Idh/MocA family oxidoreductase n=1 Tax=Brachybacterium sp. AOP35-5H-19 TaxID=3457685 RepID=UPI003FB9E8AA